MFVRNSAKNFSHIPDNANVCLEYDPGEENIVGNSANNVWNSASFVRNSSNFVRNSDSFVWDSANFVRNSASFVWNTANFVQNMTKIPAHIPDVNLHCPECDQKSWHYSRQTFPLSGK